MKTIIFDFDGTLADSFGAIVKMAYKLTKNPKLNDDIEIAKIKNSSLYEMAHYLGVSKLRLLYLFLIGRRQINDQIGEIKPYPGIKEVVSRLQSSGYKLYLLSSNNKRNIQQFLSNNGMNGCFSEIYSAIGLRGKTKTLKKIIRSGKINPQDTMYIANEPSDILAARSSSIKCIAAGWGYGNIEKLKEKQPYAVVNRPEEIVPIIKEWDK